MSKENEEDLEHVQKSAVKIILGKEYQSYEDALVQADLDCLKNRREELSYKFFKEVYQK